MCHFFPFHFSLSLLILRYSFDSAVAPPNQTHYRRDFSFNTVVSSPFNVSMPKLMELGLGLAKSKKPFI